MLGNDVLQGQLASAHHRAYRPCPRDDPVRYRRVFHAVQPLHPFDGDHAAARAAHLCAHRIEKILKVDDLGLFGTVAQDADAVQKHARHHQIFGRAHAGQIEHYVRRLGVCAVAVDVPVPLPDRYAELAQPGKVYVDRSQTYVAAARVDRLGAFEPRQKRPEHEHRRAQFLRRIAGDLVRVKPRAVYLDDVARPLDLAAELAQYAQHHRDVSDVGAAVQHHFFGRQN